MPVRIVKDKESSGGGGNRGGGGGGLGIGAIIAILLFVFRYPKIGVPLLIIGGLFFWWKSCDDGGSQNQDQVDAPYGLGAQLNREEFDQALVYEPLAPGQLPGKVSLTGFAPAPGDQGQQGSCTSWATAYSARTIQLAHETGQDPDNVAFSPSFLYNQMSRGSCEGTSIRKALDNVQQDGVAPLSEFQYDDKDCSTQPDEVLKKQARNFRIAGYNRLTRDDDNYAVDITAVKQNLAQGAPVVIGMLVGGTFYKVSGPGASWEPTDADNRAMQASANGRIVNDGDNSQFGGHAMCIVGYDDAKDGGSFHIQNSWGKAWGDNGTFWMTYSDFEQYTNGLGAEVYGLFPTRPKEAPKNADFQATVGLVGNDSKKHFPVSFVSGNTFATTGTLAIKTQFKIEVANTIPCYTYVFAQETDGTSNVLFPYTAKHSPYCGIVGKRLFPKDYSMELDDLGTTDYMAVLLTKEEVDFKDLNDRASRSRATTYEGKLREALGSRLAIQNVQYKAGQTVQFTVPKGTNADAVLVVFEIRKGN